MLANGLDSLLFSYVPTIVLALIIISWLLNVFSRAESPQIVYASSEKDADSAHGRALAQNCPILVERYAPPLLWGRNGHLQTLLFGIVGRIRPPRPSGRRETRISRDGTSVAFDVFDSTIDPSKPIIVVCPGIGGSVESTSVRVFVDYATSFGHGVVVFNHVGVVGSATQRRLFTYGGTDDFDVTVQYAKETFPCHGLVGFGVSMGANILVKYLGEKPERQKDFLCAMSVCQGYDILKSKPLFTQWNQGRFFYNYLITKKFLETVKRNANILFNTVKAGDGFMSTVPPPNKERTLSATSLYDVDEYLQRRLHGYESVEDYYREHSCCDYLDKVTNVPLLIVNASDDPLVPESLISIARNYAAKNSNALFVQTKHGGHLGFFEGRLLVPRTVSWLDRLAIEFINAVIQMKR